MNSAWFRKIGLTVSLILVFGLQAFLPLSLKDFNVAPEKWFFLQFILLVIFLALVFRLLNATDSGENDVSNSRGSLNSDNFIDPKYLIGAVVHEIRTPINKLSLMLDRQEDLTKESRIRNTLDELTGLVDHIEDVFRQNNTRKEWVSSVTFLKHVTDRLDPDAAVRYVIESGWLYLDPNKMKLTVSNLIENGLEAYNTPDKTVTVLVRSVGPEWCIIVRDEAGGMDAETARVISSKGNNEQSNSSGMGLGLLIARRVVENHNGRMVVESDPSVGTEVTITLPKPRSG